MKQEEILKQLQDGAKLYKLKCFIKSISLMAKIKRGTKDTISYYIINKENIKTRIHHKTGKSLETQKFVETVSNSFEKTLGGSRVELKICPWKCDKF